MSTIGFLFDEHVPSSLAGALLAMEPTIRVEVVGVMSAPPKRTTDPDLLKYADSEGLIIVSFDKRTMPDHAYYRMAQGKRTRGVIVIPNDRMKVANVADDLLLAWAVTELDSWIDRVAYLPF